MVTFGKYPLRSCHLRESCATTQVAVILAHSNVSHVRIASVDDKLFIYHEPLEQQNTRALGKGSGDQSASRQGRKDTIFDSKAVLCCAVVS